MATLETVSDAAHSVWRTARDHIRVMDRLADEFTASGLSAEAFAAAVAKARALAVEQIEERLVELDTALTEFSEAPLGGVLESIRHPRLAESVILDDDAGGQAVGPGGRL